MRILIINPNSSLEMTEAIHKSACGFAKGDFEVVTLHIPESSPFVATYEDHARAASGMMKIIRDNNDDFDAFVIACHGDPNLDLMKEICDKPVVGIAEASMKMATMLGDRFSVISPVERNIPNKRVLIEKYHLEGYLASIRAPQKEDEGKNEEQRLMGAARKAIDEDMAEVIVLGCAGFAGLDKSMEKELGVPVLDGVVCALIVASGMVRYGVSTSKKRRYNPVF
ncbi:MULTISPECIES: aspartate/glutamate racemase family protein [Aminobacterium]|jgi:allantoin racemase|uniref:Asp/Glu/hydantoin racemase n=1 Tax=Aminobacterium colombiense (strain DSM 12261 / ALA-1) TaxID=572547 RepID=D5EHB4_AMICL|nr:MULTISPECIES: aspartate/glutamate racemase family protein [Aminobacterium]MDD2379276.1 aspartate/glutamate racemase family protein [Aminobacterium colombiense]ADE57946.1 Asp/Glu/hydantoin racemase [Aminobacterium colombiense DSM 12261]MDD3767855.1 aspartate/glutamate racemase family protein [Aminobacterium colombiense]MDD4265762.1 aspartate/glutamate racemase family protein [Aminobacterium colombiense]MDD4585194.1 aspartate/glutamate racemase family protein [Aminobacterium colombiense]